MRVAIGIAVVALLLAAGAPARASDATPISPPSGSNFTTTDVVTFKAGAGADERDHVILFSPGTALNPARSFTFGNVGGEEEVDLGWLAGKFDHLGAFAWATCPQEPDYDVLVEQCSPAWTSPWPSGCRP
jgi:hypothetical protein